MFEHRTQPLLAFHLFIRRLLRSLGTVVLLVAASLIAGMIGYRVTEGMGWVDAGYNASLILSGMGPAGELKTVTGKIFASVYALYSGLFLIAMAGLLLAPAFHRMMHRFHVENDKAE